MEKTNNTNKNELSEEEVIGMEQEQEYNYFKDASIKIMDNNEADIIRTESYVIIKKDVFEKISNILNSTEKFKKVVGDIIEMENSRLKINRLYQEVGEKIQQINEVDKELEEITKSMLSTQKELVSVWGDVPPNYFK